MMLNDIEFRLNNLYYIIDKKGNEVLFKFNWAQKDLFKNYYYLNIIPKARQLGISTFISLLFLDSCLFNKNVSAGIIAHTREDAEYIFRSKIKYPYERLPKEIREKIPAKTDSARELSFANNSSIRVGTSLRSSTFNYLHISEFGKICAKYPEKADEIVSGSLNTVHPGNFIFIESTAEGRGGYFYEYTKIAEKNRLEKVKLGALDFKLHFYPWWKHPEYSLEDDEQNVDSETYDYFLQLKNKIGIECDKNKQLWYYKKKQQQGEFIYREYPSSLEEAFMVSNEGFFYQPQFVKIYKENRITSVPYDTAVPVHTFWDLGINDTTCIWFTQFVGKEIHLIDYYEMSGEGLQHYVKVLHNKDYCYGDHWFPHDVRARELGSGSSREETLIKLGLNPKVISKQNVMDGIEACRNILGKCYFDKIKCSKGIKALENYKKEFNEKMGCYSNKPLHNWASNGADAFRTLAMSENMIWGMDKITQEEADYFYNKYAVGV
ncbi:MAG: terminase [Candidatus Thorarchaeota archaeon]